MYVLIYRFHTVWGMVYEKSAHFFFIVSSISIYINRFIQTQRTNDATLLKTWVLMIPTLSSMVVPQVVMTIAFVATYDDNFSLTNISILMENRCWKMTFLIWINTHWEEELLEIVYNRSWWRYQMDIFSALLALCDGNPPVSGGFPSQRLVTWSFHVFFDLCLNKRLSKQSTRRWFKTPSHTLWRHCNEFRCFATYCHCCPELTSSVL